MQDRYDVVVVGAGPSGLMAAKALAQNGCSVAIIDRREDLTKISRTCGQSLLPPNEYFFNDLFHYNARDQRFCFAAGGLSFPYTGPVKNLYTWYMHSPGMNRLQFGPGDKSNAPIALSYDKEIMLQCMLKDIQSDHVDVFPATEFSGIQPGPGSIAVMAGEKSFQAGCVIAADGANSRVVEAMGYNTNRRHIANLYVKSCYIKGFRAPEENAILTAVAFIRNKPVYIFLLPRPEGDEWNFLLLTLESDIDLDDAQKHIIASKPWSAWFEGVTTTREFAAVESIRSPIIKPFRNNVLIVGDAGACQELECLGAMLSGWKGGLAVATALKEQQLSIAPRAVAAYEDWWLNTYIKQYDYQDYLSIFGIAYMFSTPEIVDYVFGLLGEPFAPTFNPYTAVGLLGARLQSVFPKIMQERPDVLQQLAGKMMLFPSDIMAATLAGQSRESTRR